MYNEQGEAFYSDDSSKRGRSHTGFFMAWLVLYTSKYNTVIIRTDQLITRLLPNDQVDQSLTPS
jgi:hypothetical protein